LSVLTKPPKKSKTVVEFGGKSVKMQDVMIMLESVVPNSRRPVAGSSTFGSSNSNSSKRLGHSGGDLSLDDDSELNCPLKVAGVVFPLTTGRSLCVAYLEWLVASGAAPPTMHNDYIQFLIEGIPVSLDNPVNHSVCNLEINDNDPENLKTYKIYRRKLQHILQYSTDYNPDQVLRALPPQYLHEYALLLSRLGRHEEVLRIYVHRLQDIALAEAYCDRMYVQLIAWQAQSSEGSGTKAGRGQQSGRSSASIVSSVFSDFTKPGEVYICFLRVFFVIIF
jgi:hypothetical protein